MVYIYIYGIIMAAGGFYFGWLGREFHEFRKKLRKREERAAASHTVCYDDDDTQEIF